MIGFDEGSEGAVFRLGCCNLWEEGVVRRDQDGGGNEVGSVMNGVGRGCGEDGEGGEGRGMVVESLGEGIWFPIRYSLAVENLVVVGSKGGCPPGMSS